jgi:hypothetical protein
MQRMLCTVTLDLVVVPVSTRSSDGQISVNFSCKLTANNVHVSHFPEPSLIYVKKFSMQSASSVFTCLHGIVLGKVVHTKLLSKRKSKISSHHGSGADERIVMKIGVINVVHHVTLLYHFGCNRVNGATVARAWFYTLFPTFKFIFLRSSSMNLQPERLDQLESVRAWTT